MRTTLFAAAVVAAAPFLALGPAAAQQLSAEDFVKKVTMSDMFEIQSGQLAADQAENEDVRSFGQTMAEDHKKTSEELSELVDDEDLKIDAPTELDQDHQAKLDSLKGLSGNKFDRAYVPMQVKAHETAVDLFDRFAKSGENDDLRAWAGDTLPALKEHLKQAKALNEAIKSAPETAARDDDDKAENDKDKTAANDRAPRSDIKFVTRQEPSYWSAEALIGRTVENAEGENLGEINNVVLNEKGSVVAVTIGVGGFLGIGEKNVGVPFDALEFRADRAPADRPDRGENEKPDRTASRFDTEHANIRILLNASHEQLEKAPQFVWLDEQSDESAGDERVIR